MAQDWTESKNIIYYFTMDNKKDGKYKFSKTLGYPPITITFFPRDKNWDNWDNLRLLNE